MRHLVPLLFLSLLACSNSHSDLPDGAVTEGCTGVAPNCVQASANHTCGDAFLVASCVDDAWQCASGWTLETSADCWCYGPGPAGCTCAPSGWSCTDGGVDDACPDPSDWGAAEGTPCPNAGQYCGECIDPCGFCNLLGCEGGVWTHLEAFPPPPDTCTAFDCGSDLRCNAMTQYCFREIGTYSCEPYPADCTSCDCLAGDECTGDAETGITVRIYGP